MHDNLPKEQHRKSELCQHLRMTIHCQHLWPLTGCCCCPSVHLKNKVNINLQTNYQQDISTVSFSILNISCLNSACVSPSHITSFSIHSLLVFLCTSDSKHLILFVLLQQNTSLLPSGWCSLLACF